MNNKPQINYRNFWGKVKKTDSCWLWQGARETHRKKLGFPYGRAWFNGKIQSAHRVSFQMVFGQIPKGKLILHRCDVPSCVKPDHLYAGTTNDNMRDMIERGRAGWQKRPLPPT